MFTDNGKIKQQFGQFFTTNSDYILNGFEQFVSNKDIIDPFAGSGDLLNWAQKNKAKKIKGFDIDKKYINNKTTFLNDSIINSNKYNFILTNPPYLHKNKADNIIKNKYFSGSNSIFEDLYQVSINSILNSKEGIIIVPLNFLSAENSKKIREIFFNKFKIIALNIFNEQVFNDTTYNVISFYYKVKDYLEDTNNFSAVIFPEKKKIDMKLSSQYGWQLGGDFTKIISSYSNDLGIYRLTEDHPSLNNGEKEIELYYNDLKEKRKFLVDKDFKRILNNNIIFLKSIDQRNDNLIELVDIRNYNFSSIVGKNTSRNLAHLIFTRDISIKEQEELIVLFNKELNKARDKYFSLFLTNFRDNNRKRISFDFAYKFINYIYFNKLHKKQASLLSVFDYASDLI